MSKFFCTLTIFAGMIGLVWFGFANETPYYGWWDSYHPSRQIYYVTWFFLNVVCPIIAGALAFAGVAIAWKASSAICGKLQAHFTNKTTER